MLAKLTAPLLVALAAGALLAPAGMAAAPSCNRAAGEVARDSANGPPLRLVLALDGIPYDLFVEMQAQGHFQAFKPAARMISTFPSLSDVSFAAIGGGELPAGYQIMRFDRDTNHVVGNTLAALGSRVHSYLPADSRQRSSLHRAIGYVWSYRMALAEMNRIGDDFLASDKETFVGYVEASDAMLHVHGRHDAMRFLAHVDEFVTRLTDTVRQRTGRELCVDIVSDHGSTLRRGKPARFEKALASCGFARKESLETPNDVAYSLAGIIGSVAMCCAPDRAPELASCLLHDPAVDLVTFLRDGAVVVQADAGEAEIRQVAGDDERYSYRMLRGDPLHLGETLGVGPTEPRPVERVASERELLESTADAQYPDPLRRVWRAFHGAVKEPSDVLVSLRDGWEAGNGGVRFAAKLRGRAGTHGSLTRAASLGVVASNWRPVSDGDSWDTHDVLFGEATQQALQAHRTPNEMVASLASRPTWKKSHVRVAGMRKHHDD